MDDGDDLQLSPQIINFISIKFLNVFFFHIGPSLCIDEKPSVWSFSKKYVQLFALVGDWIEKNLKQIYWQKDPIDDYGESKGLNWLTL
jgi:hypothetical protein